MSDSPIDGLAHLVRLQKHQQRKQSETIRRLERLRTACELRRRLIRNHRALQQSLAENIRTAKRGEFRLTFDAFKDAITSYESLTHENYGVSSDPQPPATKSWFDSLSSESQSAINAFVQDVASNGTFLCRRLLSLPSQALAALSRSQYCVSQTQPGAADSSASSSRLAALDITTTDVRAARQAFDAIRHDGLSLLLELVGAGYTPSSHISRDIWASVCAAMLTAKKSGSDKFVIALFDALAFQTDGTVSKRPLEIWLMEVLQDGHAFAHKADSQSFRARVESNDLGNVREQQAANVFFDNALARLFAILVDQESNHVVPDIAIALGHAIGRKLVDVPERAQAAAMFLATRWLFSSHLNTLLILPESHGILLDYYFTETARHRLLREICMRAQNAALDYAYNWKHGLDANAGSRFGSSLAKLVQLFTPLPKTDVEASTKAQSSDSGTFIDKFDVRSMCISDVVTLASILYVEASPWPVAAPKNVSDGLPPSLWSALLEIKSTQTFDRVNGTNIPTLDSWHHICLPDCNDHKSPVLLRSSSTSSDEKSPASSSSEGDILLEASADPDYLQVREIAFQLLEQHPSRSIISQRTELGSYRRVQGEKLSKSVHRMMADSTGAGDRDPFRLKSRRSLELSRDSKGARSGSIVSQQPTNSSENVQLPSIIVDFLEQSISSFERQEEFVLALQFTEFLAKFKQSSLSDPQGQVNLLYCWARELEHDTKMFRIVDNKLNLQLAALEQQLKNQEPIIKAMTRNIDELRTRMWYCCEVRPSAQFETLLKVTDAIKVMARNQNLARDNSRMEPFLRTLNFPYLQATAEAIEDLMSERRYGLSGKLNDEQVAVTLAWMEKLGIENICRGEERLHRLFYELSKCINMLIGVDSVSNAVLWASDLFRRERLEGFQNAMKSELKDVNDRRDSIFSMLSRSAETDVLSMNSDRMPGALRHKADFSIDDASRLPRTRTASDGQCSSMTTLSAATFWSPFHARTQTPFSMTSMPSSDMSPYRQGHSVSTESFGSTAEVRALISQLEKSLLSLCSSEICPAAFPEGSETDLTMWTGLGAEFARVLQNSYVAAGQGTPRYQALSQHRDMQEGALYDASTASSRLLRRFELDPSPYAKLQAIAELQSLLLVSTRQNRQKQDTQAFSVENKPALKLGTAMPSSARSRLRLDVSIPQTQSVADRDDAVRGFRDVFRDSRLRPRGLFRDLQMIASMVARDILDNSAAGKAFWNATIAALSLKQEICRMMLETADSITCAQDKSQSGEGTGHEQRRGLAKKHIAVRDLTDAAQLLVVTAKEGNAAAQRELATFYLTFPESVGSVMAPMSLAKTVFATSDDWLEMDLRPSGVALRLAHHWMGLSAQGGDALAAKYLEAHVEHGDVKHT